jgi:hypothetical protein
VMNWETCVLLSPARAHLLFIVTQVAIRRFKADSPPPMLTSSLQGLSAEDEKLLLTPVMLDDLHPPMLVLDDDNSEAPPRMPAGAARHRAHTSATLLSPRSAATAQQLVASNQLHVGTVPPPP